MNDFNLSFVELSADVVVLHKDVFRLLMIFSIVLQTNSALVVTEDGYVDQFKSCEILLQTAQEYNHFRSFTQGDLFRFSSGLRDVGLLLAVPGHRSTV